MLIGKALSSDIKKDKLPHSGGSRPVLIGGPGWGRLFCWGAHTNQEKKSFRQGISKKLKTVFTISTVLIG